MRMSEQVCVMCGVIHTRSSRANRCWDCYMASNREALRAAAVVKTAIKNGMPKPTAFACADCGDSATVYEHRDYTKPLDVEPTCRACNTRRGAAFNSFYRPEQVTQPAQGGAAHIDPVSTEAVRHGPDGLSLACR